ncbi:MAG TPA: histidine phosphatase family protein [Verrucomicrobiae bacterium]|nr:histidine phosphatase family protein [Verrucomicrobiae bacterium]
MELVFVRHGETAWNAARRFQGQSDVPLSSRGVAQAAALEGALADLQFTHAYSSDLIRAVETARTILRGRDVPLATDARLREFNFGEWEGLTWNEIVARWPELGRRLPTQARLYEPIGGERFEHVQARVRAFLDDLRESAAATRALVVTHAGALHAAMEVLRPEGFDPRGMVFSTASITRVAMEAGRARIISLNDVNHLDFTA